MVSMNTVYLRSAAIEAPPLQLETILLNPENIALADVERALQQLHSLKFVTVENPDAGGEGKGARPSLPTAAKPPELPPYESPRLTAMKENEVPNAFQVPVVATTWWG
jgi:hypothetical protein